MQTISISKVSSVVAPAAQVEAVSEPLSTTQQNFGSILEKQRKLSGSQVLDQRKPLQNTAKSAQTQQKDGVKMSASPTAQTSKAMDTKPMDIPAQAALHDMTMSEIAVAGLKETDQALLPYDESALTEEDAESQGLSADSTAMQQIQLQLQAQMAVPLAPMLPANTPAGTKMLDMDTASHGAEDLLETSADFRENRRAIIDDHAPGLPTQSNPQRADFQSNQKSSETWLQNALPMSGVDTGSERNMVRRMDQSVDAALVQTNAGQGLPTGITLSANAMQQLAQGVGSTNVLNSAPGKAGWDQAMSQKIVWMLGSGTQSAELTLNPPDLGPLQVVIQVNNDQANAQFMSENPAVRQALEAGLEQLREKLSESGVQLGQTSVSDGSRQQSGYGQAAHDASRPLEADRNASVLPVAEQHAPAGRSYGSNGLINTFA